MPASYAEWLSRRIAERMQIFPSPAIHFSLLTTVYEKTDANLFLETAANLTTQTLPFTEWIILAHGLVSPALNQALERIGEAPRIRIFHLPKNLGIVGGMRFCLERATGDYIVPMDADDLLTPDALQVLAAAIAREAMPAFLYSDEDMLVDGQPQSAYCRPGWDEVLNLTSSYIWHLVTIRRDVALEFGFYTDSKADFCHDWDSVFRVAAAGYSPVHVPEILYHWRQHPASSTHRPDPDGGSRCSTRHVLEKFIASQARPELYFVEDFPIFRGAPEWHVARYRRDAPEMTALILGRGHDLGVKAPMKETRIFARSGNAADLIDAATSCRSPYIFVSSDAVRPVGEDWFWEAVKLFELHRNAALVQGLIVDQNDIIVRGGETYLSDGALVCPQAGKPARDAGPFAMALKPHQVAAATTDFFFVKTAFLKEAAKSLRDTPLAGLGIALGAKAITAGCSIAFSPLIKAQVIGPLVDGPPERLAQLAYARKSDIPTPMTQIFSVAGFIDLSRRRLGKS